MLSAAWRPLRHGKEVDGQARAKRPLGPLPSHIAVRGIEPDTGQRGHQFKARESLRQGLLLAPLENGFTDAATCEIRMYKECADLCGVLTWIQLAGVAVGARIAAKERSTPAPASAADQLIAILDHKIRAIANQLRIDAKGTAQRALDL